MMRNRVRILTSIWLALMGLIMIWGCSDEASDQISAEEKARADSLAQVEADEDLLRAAAAKLIGLYAGDLQTRLTEAMQTGGSLRAIEECVLVAPAVGDSLSTKFWTVRRVSDKYRNPDNRVMAAERDIMTIFTDTTQPKRPFFGDWQTEDSVTTYRYYKPIFVGKLCLGCHGDMQTLKPGVYQAVKKHYPADRATGYKEGDLRGMFVVEAVWPEGRKFAEQLLGIEADSVATADTIK